MKGVIFRQYKCPKIGISGLNDPNTVLAKNLGLFIKILNLWCIYEKVLGNYEKIVL